MLAMVIIIDNMIGYVLAILVGPLWYFRLTKQHFYLYRWPLAIIVGTGMALRSGRSSSPVHDPDNCAGC
jgi:hypothetical protein